MKRIITFLFSATLFAANAQNFKQIDEKMAQFQSTFSENAMADVVTFINNNFSTETDKLRAIFVWITDNFEYDVVNMFNIQPYADEQEIVESMLRNRIGVCMHYAYLFAEIANELGIKTYIVAGITMQNNVVNSVPHVWNASLVDSVWYLIDPTWGAGFVQNGKFVQRRNDFYFKTASEDLIRSHLPFDPMWQLLNYLVSAQNFLAGRTEINTSTAFFDFENLLNTHINATRIEQLTAVNRRIEQNKINHQLAQDYLKNNIRELQHLKNEIAVHAYNSAVASFNKGVNLLNEFIHYRNRQFTPQRSEEEIRSMVADAENALIEAQNELRQIITTDREMINLMTQLKHAIDDARAQVVEQNAFIDKYFSTGRAFRKSLFYKYTWMGIPLN